MYCWAGSDHSNLFVSDRLADLGWPDRTPPVVNALPLRRWKPCSLWNDSNCLVMIFKTIQEFSRNRNLFISIPLENLACILLSLVANCKKPKLQKDTIWAYDRRPTLWNLEHLQLLFQCLEILTDVDFYSMLSLSHLLERRYFLSNQRIESSMSCASLDHLTPISRIITAMWPDPDYCIFAQKNGSFFFPVSSATASSVLCGNLPLLLYITSYGIFGIATGKSTHRGLASTCNRSLKLPASPQKGEDKSIVVRHARVVFSHRRVVVS